MTTQTKPTPAQRAVLIDILAGLNPYDSERAERRQVDDALAECEAAGWVDANHEATPAGREAARRARG